MPVKRQISIKMPVMKVSRSTKGRATWPAPTLRAESGSRAASHRGPRDEGERLMSLCWPILVPGLGWVGDADTGAVGARKRVPWPSANLKRPFPFPVSRVCSARNRGPVERWVNAHECAAALAYDALDGRHTLPAPFPSRTGYTTTTSTSHLLHIISFALSLPPRTRLQTLLVDYSEPLCAPAIGFSPSAPRRCPSAPDSAPSGFFLSSSLSSFARQPAAAPTHGYSPSTCKH